MRITYLSGTLHPSLLLLLPNPFIATKPQATKPPEHTYTHVHTHLHMSNMHTHACTHAHTHLVQWSPAVNRTVLNDLIHSLGDGSGEVGVGKLRMEEYLRSQEPLVAYIHLKRFLGDRVDAVMHLEPLGRVAVVLAELLGNVRTHIAIGLLHREGRRRGGEGRQLEGRGEGGEGREGKEREGEREGRGGVASGQEK